MFELEIEIDGFSGPLDLLCSLVESKQFRASNIKITKLIKIYGLYLAKTQQATADTLAEFFYMTAGLLLEKTKSLLPGEFESDENAKDFSDEFKNMNEEEIIKALERYKPYRAAYKWLGEKFLNQSRFFRRENINNQDDNFIIEYNNIENGIYILAKTWRELYEKYKSYEEKKLTEIEAEKKADWDGFAESQSEQEQIQIKIAEIKNNLLNSEFLSFNDICKKENFSRRNLIVTVLALLEMCRIGDAYIEQDELFSDIKIYK